MMPSLVPRFNPQYDAQEWRAVFGRGDQSDISRYEQAFAEHFGCQAGVMFAHGRTGIYALLQVWQLQGAEVIMPAYTCSVVADAVILSGNTPVFVDCEADHFNMSLWGIEQAITAETRVIIATHLFGYAMDIHAVQGIADAASAKYGHKVYVIQDCAHSYGTKWQGELVSQAGDAAVFGCNISKIMNSIFGGMVTSTQSQTITALRAWREQHCSVPKLKSLKRLCYFIAVNIAFWGPLYSSVNWLERKGFLDRFVRYVWDDKVRFPDDWDTAPVPIEARVGLVQLSKYPQMIAKRQEKAKAILKQFDNQDKLKFHAHQADCTYSHMVAVVDNRDAWVEHYRQQGIQLGILIDYSVPCLGIYQQYRRVPTPNADYLAQHCINFPLGRDFQIPQQWYPELEPEHLQKGKMA